MVDQSVTITGIFRDQLSKPLEKAGAILAGIFGRAQDLTKQLNPAIAQLTTLASGVAAAFAVDQALDKAEERVKAERLLLTALDERIGLQKEIIQQIKEIGAATNTSGTELIRTAALIKNIVGSAREIPRILKVSVDTAAAIQLPLETVARSIAGIGEGGSGRALLQSIPQLKGVIKEGQTLEEVLANLEQRFEGVAEAAADTDFGHVEHEIKRISAVSIEFGKQIVVVKEAVVHTIAEIVEAIGKVVTSPAGKELTRLTARIAPTLIVIGAAAAGVVAAIGTAITAATVLGFVVKGIAGLAPIIALIGELFTAVLIPALPIVATLVGVLAAASAAGAALGAGILKIVDPSITFKGTWEEIRKVVGDVAGGISDILKGISEGRLTIDDLFDFFKVRIAQASVLISSLADVTTVTLGKIRGLVTGGAIAGSLHARALLPFLPSEQDVADAKLRIGNLVTEITALNRTLEDSQAASTERIRQAQSSAIEKEIAAEVRKNDRILADANDLRDKLASIKEFRASIISPENITSLSPEKVKEFLSTIDAAQRDAVTESVNKFLENQLAAKEISFDRFIALRRAAEQAISRENAKEQATRADELEREVALLDQRGKKLDEQIAIRKTDVATMLVVGSTFDDIVDAENEILELERKRTETNGSIKDLTSETLRLRKQEQENLLKIQGSEQKILELRLKQAEAALALLKKQSGEISSQLQSGAAAFSTGGLSRAELIDQTADAVARLNDRARETRKEIVSLLGSEPALQGQLKKLLDEFDKETRDVRLKVKLEAAEVDEASIQKTLDTAIDRVQKKLSLGTISPSEAVTQVESAIASADEALANLRVRLFDVLTTPGISVETANKVREITGSLKEIPKAAEAATESLAEDLVAKVQSAAEEMRTKLAEISEQKQAGAITSSDAFRQRSEALAEFRREADLTAAAITRLAEAHPELNEELKVLADRLQAIKDKALPEEAQGIEGFFNAIGSGATDTVERLSNVGTAGQEFGEKLVNGFGDFIEVLARGQQSLGEFTRNFVADLVIMIAKLIAFNALKRALGLFGGGGPVPGDSDFIGPLQARNKGGPILRFAPGGSVPGPSVHRDIVPALLTPGEFVMDEGTVAHYGADYMDALWRRVLPRDHVRALARGLSRSPVTAHRGYAGGGEVAAGGGASRTAFGGGFQRAVMVGNDQEFERLAHGGEQAWMRFVTRNSSEMRSALGLGGLGRV